MKEVWKAAAVCMAIFMLTGCSSREDKEQYLQPSGLEPMRVTFVDFEAPKETVSPEDTNPAGEQADPESPERGAEFQAEVSGAEEESVMTVSRAAEVYNHPSEGGSGIGSVRRGESISAIGPTESGDWYMIEYNGRVAYVESDVIAGREAATAPTPGRPSSPAQPTPSGQPSTGIPSSSPEQSTGQQPSQGQSGTTNPTPGPTVPPVSTASPTPEPTGTTTPTETQPPSPEPTDTVTPTETPTQPPSPEPTEEPTAPSEPAETPPPSSEPTEEPTAPSEPAETPPPSSEPTEEPTAPSEPAETPTPPPSSEPTEEPTAPSEPTETATPIPSLPDIEPPQESTVTSEPPPSEETAE